MNAFEPIEELKNRLGLTEAEEAELADTKLEDEINNIATEINTIKRTTANNVLSAAVEIGRLLCEAQTKVKYGEWGNWLKNNVSYSVTNANNMMRLFREREKMAQTDFFGENDIDMFEGFSMSQAVALLELPAGERKDFIEKNNAQEMSVREIRAAIKAKEEAEKKAEETEKALDDIKSERDQLSDELDELEKKLAEANRKKPDIEAEKKKIEAEAEKKYKAETEKKIEAAKKAADKKIEEAKKESAKAAKAAAEAFEKEKADIRRAEREKAEAEAAEKVRALEEKLASVKIASSPRLVEFKVHMQALQSEYAKMLAITEAAEAEEPEVGKKLRSVLERISEALC